MKIHPFPDAGKTGANRIKSNYMAKPGRLFSGLAMGIFLFAATAPVRAETVNIVSSPPNFIVTWSSSSYLERAYDLRGPWAIVPDAVSPFTFTPTDSQQFFRLASSLHGTNQPPNAVNDFYSMAHDQLLFIPQLGVLYNDSATNGDPLTAIIYAPPQHGTVSLFVDGSFLYQPNAGFVGLDYFEYLAQDGLQPSAVATVSISVTDSPPVVVNDSFGVPANITSGVSAPGVLRHASALPGDSLTAMIVTSPGQGSLSLHSDGSFEYTPNNGFTGTDTFTYSASNGSSTSSNATISLIVHGGNQAPVAGNTNYSMAHDGNLSVGAPGLLSRASDADGDTLTASEVTPPANGALSLMPDGSFMYQPAAGFTGTDSFTWEAQDGTTNSVPATISIFVTNAAPVAVADTFNMQPGQTLTNPAPGVLSNDTDADGDTLTAVLASNPSHGILTLNTNGSFTYQPTNNFIGTDSFTYSVSDGLSFSGAVATVSIIVSNRPPVAVADSYGACQNSSITVLPPGVLENDTDPDGNPMIAATVGLPAHGGLIFSTNGGFVYSPDTGYSGPDSFTYAASDAYGTSVVATVSLTVTTNCTPPIAVEDSYITRPNETLSPNFDTGVLVNDEDENNLPLSAQLVTGVSNGTLTLNGDGSFTYVPANNFIGDDSFTYKAFNGSGFSDIVTVSISVTDAVPVSVADSFDVHGTNQLVVYAPGVLENDYDADDGDVIAAVLAAGPRHGILSLDQSGEFTYTATNGFLGTDWFSYCATDGTETGAVTTVTINVRNQRPIAGDDEAVTTMNTPLSVTASSGVLANDTDDDDDALTAVLGDRSSARIIVQPECRWFIHLHTEHRFHRDRHFHLHGQRQLHQQHVRASDHHRFHLWAGTKFSAQCRAANGTGFERRLIFRRCEHRFGHGSALDRRPAALARWRRWHHQPIYRRAQLSLQLRARQHAVRARGIPHTEPERVSREQRTISHDVSARTNFQQRRRRSRRASHSHPLLRHDA